MSSVEAFNAAQLYLDAVAAGLPAVFKSGKCKELEQSFRNFQIPLIQNKLVIKNDDKESVDRWILNETAFDTLDASVDANILDLYQNTVIAHEFAAADLHEAGKDAYLSSFREFHADTIAELNPQVISVVREDDMQKVAAASLNLLQAVHDDPANATFVKGLDKGMLEQMSNVLETSGYLMPGENDDRTASLGDQILRGTDEEKAALFEHAAIISANVEMSDTFKPGDNCAASAVMLKQAVSAAEFDDVQVTSRSAGAPDEFSYSSLDTESASVLYSVLQTAEDMLVTADLDPEDPMQCITVDQDKHAAAFSALAVYEEFGIENALLHKDVYIPGIEKSVAKEMAVAIDHLRTAVLTDARTLGDDGNEGERALESSAGAIAAPLEGAFDSVDKDAEKDEETGETSKKQSKVYQVAEMGVDMYGASERKVRVIEGLVKPLDNALHDWTQDGTINQIARHAGRTHENWSGREASEHGDLDQFLDTGVVSSRAVSFASTEMSQERYQGLPKDRRDKIRPMQIKPGHGPFKDYRPGNAANAPKNLQRYVRDNMLLPNGKPNVPLRTFMQEGNQSVLVGTYLSEAHAARSIFSDFVEHSNAEYKERVETSQKKQGITDVDMKSSDVMRFIQVARAANPGKDDDQILARFTLTPDGKSAMTRDDSPKIVAKMNSVPKEIENGTKAKRSFGGNLSIKHLETAIHGGREDITVRFAGEVPFTAIAKVDEEKALTKKQSRFQDVQLS